MKRASNPDEFRLKLEGVQFTGDEAREQMETGLDLRGDRGAGRAATSSTRRRARRSAAAARPAAAPARPRPRRAGAVAERPGRGASRGARTRAPQRIVAGDRATLRRSTCSLVARTSRRARAQAGGRGFAAEDVGEALERLRAAKLVDDRRRAIELVQSRLRRAPQGRRRLRAELERRGLGSRR